MLKASFSQISETMAEAKLRFRIFLIAMKFGRLLDIITANMSAKFQNNIELLTSNSAAPISGHRQLRCPSALVSKLYNLAIPEEVGQWEEGRNTALRNHGMGDPHMANRELAQIALIYYGLNTMANISQTTFSNAFFYYFIDGTFHW